MTLRDAVREKSSEARLLLLYWLCSLVLGLCINNVNVNRLNILFYAHILLIVRGMDGLLAFRRETAAALLGCYGLCAALFFGFLGQDTHWWLSMVFYNACSFALQLPLGFLADKLDHNLPFAAAGCLLIGVSFLLRNVPLLAAIACGIGNGMFADCAGLSEVVIPDGVKGIGDYAFSVHVCFSCPGPRRLIMRLYPCPFPKRKRCPCCACFWWWLCALF